MKKKTNVGTRAAAGVVAVTSRGPSAVALPSDLSEKYSKYVNRDAASSKGGGGWPYIGTRGATFTFNQEPAGEEMLVVVLGALRENTYYPGKFDAKTASGPTCFALATDPDFEKAEERMAPPAELTSKEHATCLGCPQNAFGSADNGKGKACKNTVRLVLLPWSDGDLAALEKNEGARLRVPVTSVKNWSAFAGKITKGAQRPLFSCLVRILIAPDPKTQMKMTFELMNFINDRATLDVLQRRTDEAETHLLQIQMPSTEDMKAAKTIRGTGKTKGLVKKTVVRKRLSR